MKITFDLNMAVFNPNREKEELSHFVVAKEVRDSDSLRELAVSVMKESGVQLYIDYINRNLPTTLQLPIMIYVKSEKTSNILDALKNSEQGHFGIKYRINSDETIRLLRGYHPLHADITFLQLRELVKSGYISGDYNYLIIDTAAGLGAGSLGDLTNIIEVIGNVLTVSEISIKSFSLIKKIVSIKKNRKWKKIAENWKENNGFIYLKELRDLFDSKGDWQTNEIKKD